MTIQEKIITEINRTERLSAKNTVIHNADAFAKFIVTAVYTAAVVSTDIYAPLALIPLVFYNIVIFILGEIPFRSSVPRILAVMPFVILIGIGNVISDRTVVEVGAGIYLCGGVVTFISIFLRGILTVTAVYLFICTTGFYPFSRKLMAHRHLRIFGWILSLLYRYIILMLEESSAIMKAYTLRRGESGISLKAAGSVLGLFFLRVSEKADRIYGSMQLRGFGSGTVCKKMSWRDFLYIFIFVTMILFFRFRGR